MLDFLMISTDSTKKGYIDVYPKFIIKKTNDLMIRGGDFYAIWDSKNEKWSTDEHTAIRLIDDELKAYCDKYVSKFNGGSNIRVKYLWDSSSGSIDAWHKYCQKQMRDDFVSLDESLIFQNSDVKKEDYSSKCLPYSLEKGSITYYDKLIGTLYTNEERHKIEWAIGSIVTGQSKTIQKFMVLYGSAGTGKSTILNIIEMLFKGYYSVFDAKALGSSNNSFALEAFKTNPLVAIQHDGDLSRIEDNTRLNSLVSHELMTVNEKFRPTYPSQFKCFLFMGTNKPVKITDGKSGLIRRLIDVSPSGHKLEPKEYKECMKNISFELGAIAYHCKEVFEKDPGFYDNYIPISMMSASNDFYNFVTDSYFTFKKQNGTTLKIAWEMYKTYCQEANVSYPFTQRVFKEELKTYFWDYKERYTMEDGTRVRSYYLDFKTEIFDENTEDKKKETLEEYVIDFKEQDSIFDNECSSCLAQYATENGVPIKKWEKVKTTLKSIDTHSLHYVKVPENHIVIDFDIPDENGNKSLELNLKEASKWPKTYAELSKSGQGIHLHYIYTGDVSKLSRIFDDHIEIKVYSGGSSLRRKLSKCNNLPIEIISSGLPLKGGTSVLSNEVLTNEKAIRALIKKNLNKEIHGATKPSIDFIYKILDDAYNSGMVYDVTNMRGAVLAFAMGSTNQATYCIKRVNEMKFKSENERENDDLNIGVPIVFYDVEVFPNLFLVNWKFEGEDKKVVRMINPTPQEIEQLIKYRLVGFNNRRYDNHILYACLMGYSNEGLFDLSQKIIAGSKNAFFSEAYNLSYTDIYDFAATKQSLKKWEIELGIHHQELGLPWDKPVPEDMWIKVAEYCDNDVIATEAVWNHLQADFAARKVLASIAKMSTNDTTNSLSTRIIFGNNKHPQDQFNYRDLGKLSDDDYIPDGFDEYTRFNKYAQPVFPGYTYSFGKSTYRGETTGEGGYVHARPGMYWNVALLDISSMHPSTIIAELLFGKIYTKRFEDIKEARIAIKHKDYDKARTMLDGELNQYIDKIESGEISHKDLAQALKIVINAIYGLTSAKFDNAFKDPRNVDNIVAKRGALFMINLKHEVENRGYTVAHIKTDSIKIPDADMNIIQFVMDYGKMYGYSFEHEATYDRMCLVNDAVYIAKFATEDKCKKIYGYAPGENIEEGGKWTATGTQFAVPYVFKTLFSHEPILFEDMCETKSSTSALYLDMNEKLPDVTIYEKLKTLREKSCNGKLYELTKREMEFINQYEKMTDDELNEEISKGHDYRFIGKVGSFCPVKSNCGGGLLLREKDGKYYAAGGTKGFRWMESETIKLSNSVDIIDKQYYINLVNDSYASLSKYGDVEGFLD